MISGAQPWYWQAQEDPVAAAQSAEVEAALVFAEQENHRAAQGQRLLKQTEEELRRIRSKLVDLRGMLSVSETARKWAQAEFSISEERRAIQVCSLDAEVILHREDAELQRQRAESSERLRHRLETGISYVVGAIAGVTMPVSSIERKRFDVRDDLETGVCVDAVCAPLTSRVPGREDPIFFASNKYCQPVLGSLRREIANARAAARAALRHLHMARATSAAATHRADIAEMRIELAFDRVKAAESAGLAMAAEIAQLKLQSSFVAVSASDAASAGFAASEAAHSCALARAVESDAAFTAAMMANQKAMGMIVSMQRGNASDIAVAAAAQSVCAARTAIALSRSGVAAAAAASSEQAGDDLRAHETTRAKARIRFAEQDVATLAVLSGAHTSVAQEAVFYSVLNIRRAAAAEFAFEALRSSHERAITDAQASRAQLADFQNRSLGSLIAARKSIHDAGISLVEELRALEGLMILRLFGWHEMLVRTQKKLLCVEGHARRHHALMNRRLSAASEALVVAENDAASLHRLKDTGEIALRFTRAALGRASYSVNSLRRRVDTAEAGIAAIGAKHAELEGKYNLVIAKCINGAWCRKSRASPKLTISSSTGNIGVSLGGSGIEGSVELLPGDLVKDAMGQQVLSRSWGHSHIARHLNTAMRSVRRSQTLLDEGGC